MRKHVVVLVMLAVVLGMWFVIGALLARGLDL